MSSNIVRNRDTLQSPRLEKKDTARQDRPPQWRGSRRVRSITAVILVVAVVAALFHFVVLRPPLVSVAPVVRGDVADEVEGTGTVTADVLADVASKITGRVEQVFVDEGDAVHKGQIVAMLDQTDLRRQRDAARARLAAAQATAAERQREWDRERGLVASGAVSVEDSQQYRERLSVASSAVQAAEAEADAADYNLSLVQIPALFDGIVTKRWVVPGASVVPGQPMFTVADTDLIYVSAYLDQDVTGRLRKGEPASVILRGRENRPLPGRVLRINPQADAATEETIAEVAFAVPQDEFLLGQWADIYIQTGEADHALMVPKAALMPVGNRTFVFAVGGDDVLRREPVTVLAESPRKPMVAVSGNLQPQERVVVMPMGLTSGEKVRPRPMGQGVSGEAKP